MSFHNLNPALRLLLAILFPLLAWFLQWSFWSELSPLTWILFYPAVFLSAAVGGRLGGVLATCLATLLGVSFFDPPRESWAQENFRSVYSTAIFAAMGLLFSQMFERLSRAMAELRGLSAQALSESEARWQFALEGSNQGIWDWDIAAGKVFFSSRWKAMLGYAEDEISDCLDEWATRVHPDDLPAAMAAVQKHWQGETACYQNEHRMRNRNGEYQWILDQGMVVNRDAAGQPLRMIGTHIDLTEQHQLLDALQDSKHLIRSIIDSLESSIAVLDEQGVIIRTNLAWQRFAAENGAEHASRLGVGQNYFDVCRNAPDEPEAAIILEGMLTVLDGRQASFAIEYPCHSENIRRWFKLEVLPLKGKVRGLVAHHHDISKRKRTEETLRQNERLLADSQAIAHIGSWMIDIKSGRLTWSEEGYRLFGLQPEIDETPTWEQFLDLLHPDDCLAMQAWSEACLAGETPAPLEFRTHAIEGESRWLLCCGRLEKGADGQPSRLIGTVQDITQRKKVEAALAQENNKVKTLMQLAGDGIHILDLNGNLLQANDAFCHLLRYPHQQILRMNVAQWDAQWSQAELLARIGQLVKEGGVQVFETRHLRSDGVILDVEISVVPIVLEEQCVIYASARDMTERKRNAERLQQSEQWFRTLFECSPDPVWIIENNHFVDCNQAAVSLLGYASRKECLDTHPSQLSPLYQVDGEPSESKANRMMAIAQQQGIHRFEWLHSRADGSIFPTEVTLSAFMLEGRQALYCNWRDISERKHAEGKLRLQSAALEAAANSIIITDPQGRIEWVNPAFTKMTGYADYEAIGHNPSELVKSGMQSPDVYADLWRTVTSGQVWRGEMVNCRKDGSNYIEEQIITPVLSQQGEIEHIIAIKQDVTTRKNQEAELLSYRDHLENLVNQRTGELIKAREQAEHLSQVKSDFLANMSHEIRTPMNAVLGFCYLLEQRPLDEDTHHLVRKIHGAGHALLTIINDILDFSKIEAGRLEIRQLPFRLSHVLDQIASLMSASAADKKLEFIFIPPTDAEALIGDEQRLQQVLVNLLGNAIKFTEHGEVELRVSIDSQHGDHVNLCFAVRDTGIGIPIAHQQNIFSAFTQADSSIGRLYGGTGLGLAICHQLVGLMGGELQVKSDVGQGSEFWFVLPLQRNLKAERNLSALTNLRVLVVDDSLIAREALLLASRSLGWHADTAESGKTAILQMLAGLEKQTPYDVLLLDWKMPGIDGLATAQAIREFIASNKNQPANLPVVLMVTAGSRDELSDECGIEKVDGILSKPVTSSALYNAVTGVLRRRRQEGLPKAVMPADTVVHRIPGVRILVVDDSEINREVALCILEANGAVVSLANDGQDALDWLAMHGDAVDMVLMDIQMPRLDGYAAARQIRQNPSWATLPVIALTAGAFKNLRDAAIEAGMNDFVAKPFNVPELMALIQRWTGCQPEHRLERLRAADGEPEFSANQDGVLPAKSNVEMPALPGIDFEAVLKVWGQIDDYRAYLARFIDKYRNAGRDIANAEHNGDISARQAHKLKGAAYSLALEAVAARCVDVEKALSNGESIASAAAMLQQALDEVAAGLSNWLAKTSSAESHRVVIKSYDNLREIRQLLEQLLLALDEDSPANAERLLGTLENQWDSTLVAPIKAQLQDFNFRAAEGLTHDLLHKLKLTGH